METAKIKIPTTNEELKIFNKDICQLEKECLKELEKDYRIWMDKEFFLRWDNRKMVSCKFPICCEFCKYCGNVFGIVIIQSLLSNILILIQAIYVLNGNQTSD